MILVFCTLFDSNYLDKGLALYCSMSKNIENFKLYIFAFDEKCYEILSALRLKNVTVIPLRDIMTTSLQRLQEERTRAEFCWTCTPVVIEHILMKYRENICTYIDADIYFFANPINIIQKIIDQKCSVGLVRHGFGKDYNYGEHIFGVGKYCIEFNTFLNNREGMRVLEEWKKECIKWCYHRYEDGRLGDQKYPDKWQLKYSCVYESEDMGAGVAPWNLYLYTLIKKKNDDIWLRYRGRRFQLIFYHFEGMKYLDNGKIYLNLWNPYSLKTGRIVRLLYGEYLKNIGTIRRYLENTHGVTFNHMIVDKETATRGYSSIRQFVMTDGVLDGLKNWIGHKCYGYKKQKCR